MTRTDMSRKAVTARLVRTSQLRRLCLELGRQRDPRPEPASQSGRAANPSPGSVEDGEAGTRAGEERLED